MFLPQSVNYKTLIRYHSGDFYCFVCCERAQEKFRLYELIIPTLMKRLDIMNFFQSLTERFERRARTIINGNLGSYLNHLPVTVIVIRNMLSFALRRQQLDR